MLLRCLAVRIWGHAEYRQLPGEECSHFGIVNRIVNSSFFNCKHEFQFHYRLLVLLFHDFDTHFISPLFLLSTSCRAGIRLPAATWVSVDSPQERSRGPSCRPVSPQRGDPAWRCFVRTSSRVTLSPRLESSADARQLRFVFRSKQLVSLQQGAPTDSKIDPNVSASPFPPSAGAP